MTPTPTRANASQPRNGADTEPAAVHKGTKRMPAAERRDSILDAARQVFMARGLDGARTRDIAAMAGINEATMYRHFASKDDLFEAAVSAPLEQTVAQLVGVSGTPPEEFDVSGLRMRERTHVFMVDLVNVMNQISEMLGIALFRETGVARTYYQDRIAPTLATIESVIQANIAHWEHREFDPRLVVNVAFGSAWFHVTTAKLEGRPLEAERYADHLVALLFDGVLGGAGSGTPPS